MNYTQVKSRVEVTPEVDTRAFRLETASKLLLKYKRCCVYEASFGILIILGEPYTEIAVISAKTALF